ncbi:MAG: hypothetical protein FWC62_08855 [Firmicutes bacterium]|nr:hypothetical protein [Bacillota bacterium]
MQSVLEDLFFGEIRSNIYDPNKNPRLKKAGQTLDENEEILSKLLEGKEKKLFLDFLNAQSDISGNSAVEHFTTGFKLGARIIGECFMGTVD